VQSGLAAIAQRYMHMELSSSGSCGTWAGTHYGTWPTSRGLRRGAGSVQRDHPHELTLEEIRESSTHSSNGGRSTDAGFDGVELHGAHGYLSPSSVAMENKRTDGYGGDTEKRHAS